MGQSVGITRPRSRLYGQEFQEHTFLLSSEPRLTPSSLQPCSVLPACSSHCLCSRVGAISSDLLLFTSGHFICVLAVRWLGLEPTANSRYLMLSTSGLSVLSYEKDLSQPIIRFWNDTRHVDTETESEV